MSMRAALKMILVCLLVSLGVSGCVLSASGSSLTSEEYRELAQDFEESARELEVVNWYGANGARFKYQEIVDSGTGLTDTVRDGRHLALSRLRAVEVRTAGIDRTSGDKKLGAALAAYFRASRLFYANLGETLDYFDQVSLMLGREGEARQAFYVAPVAGDEVAVGDVYRQTLNDAIDEMRALKAPASLRELHKMEIEWLEARLDHLERSRGAGLSGDAEEASQLIDEKTAEWTAFRKTFEKLELKVAEESAGARNAKEVERLLGEVQSVIADRL